MIQQNDAIIIRFKRASLKTWSDNDPVLLSGEAGFVRDTGKLKIGNGNDPWSKLPYVGDSAFEQYDNLDVLPEVGDAYKLYVVISERTIYRYDATSKKYEPFIISGANVSQEYIDKTIADMFAKSEASLNAKLDNIQSSIETLTKTVENKMDKFEIGNIYGGNAQ